MLCAHWSEIAWYIYLGYIKKFILAKPRFLRSLIHIFTSLEVFASFRHWLEEYFFIRPFSQGEKNIGLD